MQKLAFTGRSRGSTLFNQLEVALLSCSANGSSALDIWREVADGQLGGMDTCTRGKNATDIAQHLVDQANTDELGKRVTDEQRLLIEVMKRLYKIKDKREREIKSSPAYDVCIVDDLRYVEGIAT